jgi:predicted DNA-binding transcriptional regulator AlpA
MPELPTTPFAQQPASTPRLRKMMKAPAVMEVTGDKTRKALDQRVERGQFVAPVKIGSRSVAWFEDEVIAWQQQRAVEREAKRERIERERAEQEARRVTERERAIRRHQP